MTALAPTSAPGTRWPLSAARISVAATAAFWFLLVLLHLVRPDLDPSWRFISEYELGDYGWMMRAAFACLAVGTAGIGIAIMPDTRGISGGFGLLLLGVSALGMLMAAVYAPSATSHLHDLGAMLDNIPFAALFIAWKLSKHGQTSTHRITTNLFAFLPLLGLVIFIASMAWFLPRNGGHPGPTVLVGWQNRFLIATQCLWILYMARLVRAKAE